MSLRYPEYISGSGAPRLLVIKPDAYLTVGTGTIFTATTITFGSAQDLSMIAAPMFVFGLVGSGFTVELSWAKITDVDDGTDTITVEEWSNGTPTDGLPMVVNGWVCDLPYCEKLTESFDPDYLIHPIYGGDAGTKLRAKFRGWKYKATANYSTYIGGDTLYVLRHVLNAELNDRVIFIPRRDNPGFQYNVIVANEISIGRFGIVPGYKGFSLAVEGKENVHEWPMEYGYGMNYAADYGTCL